MGLAELLDKYCKVSVPVTLSVTTFESPVGGIIGIADDKHLHLVCFEDSKNIEKHLQALHHDLSCSFSLEEKNGVLIKLRQELTAYFNGTLKTFTVPLAIKGSHFQREVWEKIQKLPYSSTQTYGEMATALGRPGSARAVGAACGANTHMLIIPCHRLVATGSKGGFSCGVDRKEWLLQHEKKHAT